MKAVIEFGNHMLLAFTDLPPPPIPGRRLDKSENLGNQQPSRTAHS